MARRSWRHRCGRRRRDGKPCRGWAMTGSLTCRMHGGSSPQARRAAQVRLAELSMRRAFDRGAEDLQRRLVKWWTRRVVWLAEVTGEDPRELAHKVADPWERVQLWTLLPFDVEWPAGLRPEDEPQLRLDRRYGRKPRKPAEGPK